MKQKQKSSDKQKYLPGQGLQDFKQNPKQFCHWRLDCECVSIIVGWAIICVPEEPKLDLSNVGNGVPKLDKTDLQILPTYHVPNKTDVLLVFWNVVSICHFILYIRLILWFHWSATTVDVAIHHVWHLDFHIPLLWDSIPLFRFLHPCLDFYIPIPAR